MTQASGVNKSHSEGAPQLGVDGVKLGHLVGDQVRIVCVTTF